MFVTQGKEGNLTMDQVDDGSSLPLSPSPLSTAISHLPEEILHHIFSNLSIRQIISSRFVSKLFLHTLSSPSFIALRPSLPLLALRHPRHHRHHSSHSPPPDNTVLIAFDPCLDQWLRFPLTFLPFPSSSPITSTPSLLCIWADTDLTKQTKTLVLCNPLTRSYRLLPPLGSAWSRHGTVLAGHGGYVIVLSELAALFYSPSPVGREQWLKFSLNLPSKPRSPILIGDNTVYAICDIGSHWRSQWKLFFCRLSDLSRPLGWDRLERTEWEDVLKRPRLIRGSGDGRILMIGGLRSTFAVEVPSSTVLILRLDLASLEWDEAGRMPLEMYQCFGLGAVGGSNKMKVFGGDGMVWFAGKKVRGKMAMWKEEKDEVVGKGNGGMWRWVETMPGYGDGICRGFTFNASLTDIP